MKIVAVEHPARVDPAAEQREDEPEHHLAAHRADGEDQRVA